MRNVTIAEWVLGLAVDPGRASSTAGDLWEVCDGSPRSFWWAVIQTTLAHLWSDVWRHPGNTLWMVLSGFLAMIVIGVPMVLLMGFIIRLWVEIKPYGIAARNSVYIPPWGYYLLMSTAAIGVPFLAGWNLAWRSRARSLGPALLFVLITAVTHPGIRQETPPYPTPDNWLTRHVSSIGIAGGILFYRARYLRRERRLFMP